MTNIKKKKMRKKTHYVQRNKDECSFQVETMKVKIQWSENFIKLKEKTVKMEFYSQQNYLSKTKVK